MFSLPWSLLWTNADEYNEKNEENEPCNDAGDYDLSFLSYPPVQVHIFTPGTNVTVLTPETKKEKTLMTFIFKWFNVINIQSP